MAAPRATSEQTLIATFLANRTALVQMATRIIGCRCLAEDVVQETMLKVCEGSLAAEDVRTPAPYLFRMVRNLAIDCTRRRAREVLASPEETILEPAASCPCPETVMARCQALRIVMAALQELPARTRHVFEMHRLEGVSQRDIAAQLQVSPTLVNFMVRDAHNHCRARLLSEDADETVHPAPAGRLAKRDSAVPPRA